MKHIKKKYITDNMKFCEIGPLKNLIIGKSIKNNFNSNFSFSDTNTFSDVHVVQNLHPITIAKEYLLKKNNPIILNVVTREFDGNNIPSSQGMLDDMINVRTNFYKTVSGHYPLRYSEVIYTPLVTVIRNENLLINPNEFFRLNIITATPVSDPKLEDGILNLEDYIMTKETIENIFQTAAGTNHDILILNDFGCGSQKIPVGDIVDIFNICILNYGSLFKSIIFSITTKDDIDEAIYAYFLKNIIRPQDLIQNVPNNIDDQLVNQLNEQTLPITNPLINSNMYN